MPGAPIVDLALLQAVRDAAHDWRRAATLQGFALLIYADLFVVGLHGILMDVSNVDP